MLFPVDQAIARRTQLRVGTVLRERYRLTRLLGAGGMGAVYAGRHRSGHAVAVKILHERLSGAPDAEHLFRREALLANKIEHPGVVPVIDDDVTEDGCVFLVMPLLRGETLGARWMRSGKRLPVEEVFVLAHEILGVLVAAHAQKIVHRDIKPENVFLTEGGQVRLLDFGIARLFETQDPAAASRSGRAIGTPAFMAPEQALGRTREIDGRTDLWSLAASMFTLISGQIVHQAETASEIVVRAATRSPRPLGDAAPLVPSELAGIVDRALLLDKSARWSNAQEMDEALAAAYDRTFHHPLGAGPRVVAPPEAHPCQDETHDAVTEPPRLATKSSGAKVQEDASGGDTEALHGGDLHNGPTRTAPGASNSVDATARRRFIPKLSAVAATLSVAVALLVGARIARRPHLEPQSTAASPIESSVDDTVVPMATDPRAQVHFSAAAQAWDEAAFDVGFEELERALRIDPTFAAAHLRCVLGTYWLDDATRDHYHQAVRYRAQLNGVDALLLEAYEPMLLEVPDIPATIAKLEAVSRRFPTNMLVLDTLEVLQVQGGRFDDATATVDRMNAVTPSSPIALAERGVLDAQRGDVAGATEALTRCLASTKRASACWQTMLRLKLGAGECLEAHELARRASAAEVGTATFSRPLANAIYGTGGTIEAVHSALSEGWGSNPDESVRAEDDASLFVLQGRGEDAMSSLRRWGAAEQKSRYAKTHMRPAYRTGLLLLELQRPKEAVAVAEEYLENRAAWLPGDYADDWINLVRVEYLAGAITKPEFAVKRDEWLRSESRRSGGLFALPLQWMKAYAMAVASPEDAREALDALPRFGELPRGPLVSSDQSDAIGNTYLLAGRLSESLAPLRQATRTCDALDWPIEQTWSYAHLGLNYEMLGERERACEAYDVVLRRWSGMRGRTVMEVRRRRAALSCK